MLTFSLELFFSICYFVLANFKSIILSHSNGIKTLPTNAHNVDHRRLQIMSITFTNQSKPLDPPWLSRFVVVLWISFSAVAASFPLNHISFFDPFLSFNCFDHLLSWESCSWIKTGIRDCCDFDRRHEWMTSSTCDRHYLQTPVIDIMGICWYSHTQTRNL